MDQVAWPPSDRPAVYLAGPMVFYRDPEAVFARMKDICARHGLAGVSPLDEQIGLEGLPPDRSLLNRIVTGDIELMRRLQGGLFCLDGFRRSTEMDAGTAFEVGYMKALGKPLVGWTQDGRNYPQKVRDFFSDVAPEQACVDRHSTGARSGLQRDPDGVLIHSEGCVQNAMVHVGIELSGGRVFASPDWEQAFDQACAGMTALLAGQGVSAEA